MVNIYVIIYLYKNEYGWEKTKYMKLFKLKYNNKKQQLFLLEDQTRAKQYTYIAGILNTKRTVDQSNIYCQMIKTRKTIFIQNEFNQFSVQKKFFNSLVFFGFN